MTSSLCIAQTNKCDNLHCAVPSVCYKVKLCNVATCNFTFKTAWKSGGHCMINYGVTFHFCSTVSGNLFLQSSAVGLFLCSSPCLSFTMDSRRGDLNVACK